MVNQHKRLYDKDGTYAYCDLYWRNIEFGLSNPKGIIQNIIEEVMLSTMLELITTKELKEMHKKVAQAVRVGRTLNAKCKF